MFSRVITAIKSVIRRPPPLILGRWRLMNEDKTLKMVDYSNQDHCGPCGTATPLNAAYKASTKTETDASHRNKLVTPPESVVSRLLGWPTSSGYFQ